MGASFDIEPDWHLYWNGQNDTGYPIQLEIQLPDGFTHGEVLWPAPRRHLSPGNILDHVYRTRVTLLFPVSAPTSATPGTQAVCRVTAFWLACRSECVPGMGDATLTLPVGVGRPERDSDAAERIRGARSALPRPWNAPGPFLHQKAGEDRFELSVPGARYLAFFPDTTSVRFDDLSRSGEAAGDRLYLLPRRGMKYRIVSGVLGVRDASSPDTVYFSFRVPLPEAPRKDRHP